jgi:hypothetical protein
MFMPEVTAFCYTFGENCGLKLLNRIQTGFLMTGGAGG